MTPQQKANELCAKYYSQIEHTLSEEYSPHVRFVTIQCALIAVDEILWEIIKYADNSRDYVVENSLYWQEVKQEIEKL